MKTMKLIILAMIAVLCTNFSGNAQTTEEKEVPAISKTAEVTVYYFHSTRRCETCKAVEKVSKESVEDLYGNKVSFEAYNLDDDEGELKGDEVGVSGQSLLIVSGETKIDITNEGFMNARSNPDKLKGIIKEKIDPLL